MKKKSKKVWIESDENMLDGVDFKQVISVLDEVLEKKKRDAEDIDPPDYLEQRILDQYPSLSIERLREMLKSH
jgi:hypothetical protein|tara:strand:- start:40 stop:258 length:219 start_codon:yes stop_codon:yes gene_type:complete